MSEAPRAANPARAAATEAIMARTGLSEETLGRLVHRFYDRVRADETLGPIFAARISDWSPHLERMTAFWSSVALLSGRYHGRPMEAHAPLPIGAAHFRRWLALFAETAREVCTDEGAAHVTARAERIAASLEAGCADARTAREGGAPRLRKGG